MDVIIGVGLIAVAGLLQGSFILPMTLTINWKWEHTWALFSFSGMLVMNWAIGLCIMPHLVSAISETPRSVVYSLLFFGLCWGEGQFSSDWEWISSEWLSAIRSLWGSYLASDR